MKRKGKPELVFICPPEKESFYTKIKKFPSLGKIYTILLVLMFALLIYFTTTPTQQTDLIPQNEPDKVNTIFEATKEIHELISMGAITFLAIFGSLGFAQLQSNYQEVVTKKVMNYLIYPFSALIMYILVLYMLLFYKDSIMNMQMQNIKVLFSVEYLLSFVFLLYIMKVLLNFVSMSLLEALQSNNIAKNIKKHLKKGDLDNVLVEIRIGFQALKQSIESERDRDIVYNISCILANALLSSNSEGLWRNVWKHQTDYLVVDNSSLNVIHLYYPPWTSIDEIKLSLLWEEDIYEYILIPLRKIPLRDIKYKVVSRLFPILKAISIISAQNHFYFFKNYSKFIGMLENIKKTSSNSQVINKVLKENILESLSSLLSIDRSVEKEIIHLYNQNTFSKVTSLKELLEVYPTSLHVLIGEGLKLCKEDTEDYYYCSDVLKYTSETLREYPQIFIRFQKWELLKELYINDTTIYHITTKFIEYVLQRIKERADNKFIETGELLYFHFRRAMIELFDILMNQGFEIALEDNTLQFKNKMWEIEKQFYLETSDQKIFFKHIFSSLSSEEENFK